MLGNKGTITLCLIWLNKQDKTSVSTYLLRYSILVTSIYLGQYFIFDFFAFSMVSLTMDWTVGSSLCKFTHFV